MGISDWESASSWNAGVGLEIRRSLNVLCHIRLFSAHHISIFPCVCSSVGNTIERWLYLRQAAGIDLSSYRACLAQREKTGAAPVESGNQLYGSNRVAWRWSLVFLPPAGTHSSQQHTEFSRMSLPTVTTARLQFAPASPP